MKETFKGVVGFDWDAGNRDKNKTKHGVLTGESEQVFFNEPLIVVDDAKHSQSERRFAAFGATNAGRKLVVVFTVRKKKIRVISARDMNRKERAFHDKEG